ncbi:MAG: hypothetical protein AB1705_26310 [Verrucomicrobiota bacterium]
MIANFFQSLDRHAVDYLLISGQAAVLYGAATFSEDIDLWINPTRENCTRFTQSLHEIGACYYKLTPPLKPGLLARGHGFHFTLGHNMKSEVFLDIMGTPPRVGSFQQAQNEAKWMETEWGRLRTIGLKELVELKKTQRLEDYPVISNLVLAWFAEARSPKIPSEYSWALQNIFTLTALRAFFEDQSDAVETAEPDCLKDFGHYIIAGRDVPERIENQVTSMIQERMAELQIADRRYWRPIIAELKQMRSGGELIPQGQKVQGIEY